MRYESFDANLILKRIYWYHFKWISTKFHLSIQGWDHKAVETLTALIFLRYPIWILLVEPTRRTPRPTSRTWCSRPTGRQVSSSSSSRHLYFSKCKFTFTNNVELVFFSNGAVYKESLKERKDVCNTLNLRKSNHFV